MSIFVMTDNSSQEVKKPREIEAKWRVDSVCTLIWKIRRFSELINNINEKFKSPKRKAFNVDWCLELRPSISVSDSRQDCIPIYLVRESDTTEVHKVTYRISLWNKLQQACFSEIDEALFSSTSPEHGVLPVISKSVLLTDEKEQMLPHDTLTVICEFWMGSDCQPVSNLEEASENDFYLDDNLSATYRGYQHLSEDFDVLYQNSRHSDVKVIAEGVEYQLHKVVLAARSDVFSAMLQEAEAEKKNVIYLHDVKRKIAEHLFRYIYSGIIVGNEPEVLMELCVTADKYGLYDLKDKCLTFLLTELSLENLCQFLVFSKRLNNRNFNHACQEYFRKNVAKVLRSKEWKQFSERSPAESILILEDCFRNPPELNINQNGLVNI